MSRKINRDEQKPVEAEAVEKPVEAEAPKPETPAAPAPAPKPVAAKPLNETIVLGKMPMITVRVIGGQVIFNDGTRMRRAAIVKGKPVTVTLKQ